jgi:hypothetical protein
LPARIRCLDVQPALRNGLLDAAVEIVELAENFFLATLEIRQ